MAAAEDATITTQGDGVQVTKAVVTNSADGPAIELTVTADRPGPARVTLIDRIPAGSTAADVEFASEDDEHWSIENDRLVFERVLDPDESYTTGYAIPGLDPEAVDAERLPPYLAVEPIGTGPIDEPASPAPDFATDHAPGEPPDSSQANGHTPPANAPGVDDAAPAGWHDGPDDLVTQLLADIETGAVDDATLDELRDALIGPERSTEVRIQHLQQEVADLTAYTGAIEDFLETYGTDGGVVAEMDDELGSVRDDVADLGETVARLETKLDTLSNRMDAMGDVENEVRDVREQLHGMDATVDELDTFAERFRALCGEFADRDPERNDG